MLQAPLQLCLRAPMGRRAESPVWVNIRHCVCLRREHLSLCVCLRREHPSLCVCVCACAVNIRHCVCACAVNIRLCVCVCVCVCVCLRCEHLSLCVLALCEHGACAHAAADTWCARMYGADRDAKPQSRQSTGVCQPMPAALGLSTALQLSS